MHARTRTIYMRTTRPPDTKKKETLACVVRRKKYRKSHIEYIWLSDNVQCRVVESVCRRKYKQLFIKYFDNFYIKKNSFDKDHIFIFLFSLFRSSLLCSPPEKDRS